MDTTQKEYLVNVCYDYCHHVQTTAAAFHYVNSATFHTFSHQSAANLHHDMVSVNCLLFHNRWSHFQDGHHFVIPYKFQSLSP
jgi:hypothetical protein